jgi:transposase
VRRLKQLQPGDVLMAQDETLLRLLPPLRACWALPGEQAIVPISGRNARRALFGALNLCTGHRVLWRGRTIRQDDFCAFLRHLRGRYGKRRIWLLLDEAPCHVARHSQTLARELNIAFIWLPKQCPELNAMDQLWKELKNDIAANRQFSSIDEAACSAENWLLRLSNRQALRKAGVLSKNFWLKHVCQDFC